MTEKKKKEKRIQVLVERRSIRPLRERVAWLRKRRANATQVRIARTVEELQVGQIFASAQED